ncbi:hypothetical protein HK104_006558 [Borealophlyctis nickersoniae]|nr:hypothetical protein HK104_006558 [Borealophlyctis nickersoniae]
MPPKKTKPSTNSVPATPNGKGTLYSFFRKDVNVSPPAGTEDNCGGSASGGAEKDDLESTTQDTVAEPAVVSARLGEEGGGDRQKEDTIMLPTDRYVLDYVEVVKKRKDVEDEPDEEENEDFATPASSQQSVHTDVTLTSSQGATPRKRQKTGDTGSSPNKPPLLAELKKGKVVFNEKKLNFERHPSTLAELVSFFEFKSKLDKPCDVFPAQYKNLLAKLVEESDADLKKLALSVRDQLLPSGFGADGEASEDDADAVISIETIAEAINDIALRKNYGLERDGVAPAALAILRWEVQDLSLFPADLADLVQQRRAKREQASTQLKAALDALSGDEKEALFAARGGKSKKAAAPKTPVPRKKDTKEQEKAAQKEAKQLEKERKAAEKAEKAAEIKRKSEEKAAELKRKAEEKAAEKERKAAEKLAEKEKKAAAKKAEDAEKAKGQKSLKGFFTPIKREEVKKVAEDTVAERDMYFPPFHVKENVSLAPHNRFWKPVEDAVIDSLFNEDVEVSLADFVSEAKLAKRTKVLSEKPQRVVPMDIDNEDPVISRLRGLKWKLLQFAENFRPAYWGTWSKKSKTVTGRRPFSRDSDVFDYDFDSEAEWEEDEPGEELKSDDEEEEEDGGGDTEGGDEEEDDWLVPHGYLSDDEGVEKDGDEEEGDDGKDEPVDPFQEISDLAENSVGGASTGGTSSRKKTGPAKAAFPDDRLGDLVQHVDQSPQPLNKLVDIMKTKNPRLKKTAIEQKIKDIAVKEKRGVDTKARWYIKDEFAGMRTPQGSPAKPAGGNLGSCSSSATNTSSLPTSPHQQLSDSKNRPSPQKVTPKRTLANMLQSGATGIGKKALAEDFETLAKKLRDGDVDGSLLLMSDDLAAGIDRAPETLVALLMQVAAVSGRSDLRSRCLRLLSNRISLLEVKMRTATGDSRDPYRRKWTCMAEEPRLFACINNNLAGAAENVTIKNALRLLLYFVQATDEVCVSYVEGLLKMAAKNWVPLLLEHLQTGGVEAAGYCAALMFHIADVYDTPPHDWWRIMGVLESQLNKTEWQVKSNGEKQDKCLGLKKFSLKTIGKILGKTTVIKDAPLQCLELRGRLQEWKDRNELHAALVEAVDGCLESIPTAMDADDVNMG